MRVLDEEAERWYVENLGIDARLKKYVKHILNWHDGEVRLLGNSMWEEFPEWCDRNFTVFHPHFWHYQFMKDGETRAWLYWRKTSRWRDEDLRPSDVEWIMAKEGNETTYLRFVPAAGGEPEGTWYVKQGNIVTLSEMFRFGCEVCTCYDIYRTFVHLPIFVYKRIHSASRSEPGVQRRTAKLLRHQETGRYGLPGAGDQW